MAHPRLIGLSPQTGVRSVHPARASEVGALIRSRLNVVLVHADRGRSEKSEPGGIFRRLDVHGSKLDGDAEVVGDSLDALRAATWLGHPSK